MSTHRMRVTTPEAAQRAQQRLEASAQAAIRKLASIGIEVFEQARMDELDSWTPRVFMAQVSKHRAKKLDIHGLLALVREKGL